MNQEEAVAAARLIRAIKAFTDGSDRDSTAIKRFRKAVAPRPGETALFSLVRKVWATSDFLSEYRLITSSRYIELDTAFEALFHICTNTVPPREMAKRSYNGRKYTNKVPTGRPRGRSPKEQSQEAV